MSIPPEVELRLSGELFGGNPRGLLNHLGLYGRPMGDDRWMVRPNDALEGDEITLANGDVVGPVPKPVQLIIDALIAADSASAIGGGRYLFIDTTNEPPPILNALSAVGFQSITPAGSPTHYITLR